MWLSLVGTEGYAHPGNLSYTAHHSIGHKISAVTQRREHSACNSGIDLEVLLRPRYVCRLPPGVEVTTIITGECTSFLAVKQLACFNTLVGSVFQGSGSHDISVNQTIVVNGTLVVTTHVMKWVLPQHRSSHLHISR